MVGALGLALLAGIVSVLSPCVVPLLPIVLGTAVAQHRLAPVVLACGLALSFTAVGIFVATIGFTLGIDGGVFRNAGAVVMALAGVVLLSPSMQTRIAVAAGPAGNWVDQRFGGFSAEGLSGVNLLSGCFLASYGRRALARPSERVGVSIGGKRRGPWCGRCDYGRLRCRQRRSADRARPPGAGTVTRLRSSSIGAREEREVGDGPTFHRHGRGHPDRCG